MNFGKYPETATFLTEHERASLVATLQADTQGQSKNVEKRFIWRTLKSWRSYLQVGIYIVSCSSYAAKIFLIDVIVGPADPCLWNRTVPSLHRQTDGIHLHDLRPVGKAFLHMVVLTSLNTPFLLVDHSTFRCRMWDDYSCRIPE